MKKLLMITFVFVVACATAAAANPWGAGSGASNHSGFPADVPNLELGSVLQTFEKTAVGPSQNYPSSMSLGSVDIVTNGVVLSVQIPNAPVAGGFANPPSVPNMNYGFESRGGSQALTNLVAYGAKNGVYGGFKHVSPVPEPATLALFGSGLIAGASALRRRMKKQAAE